LYRGNLRRMEQPSNRLGADGRVVNEEERNKGKPSTKFARERARYANFFQIGHNAFEFLIEFGQEENIHTRIYLSPKHAQILSGLLIQTLEQHSTRLITEDTN